MSEYLKPMAVYRIVGNVASDTTPKISKRDTPYVSFKVDVPYGTGDKAWSYWMIAFDDLAEEIGAKCKQGDQIDIKGELGRKKDQNGSWGISLTARKLEAVVQQYTQDAVDDAMGAADGDDIPW